MLNVTVESSAEKTRSTDKSRSERLKELIVSNQSARYWEWDTAEELETEKNRIYYYPNAGKLAVRLPLYRNSLGKLSGLDLNALKRAPEVLDRLIEILLSLKEQDGKAAPLENDKEN